MTQSKRIERIIREMEKLPSMRALDWQKFAEEGGYADEVVRAFGEDEKGQIKKDKIRDALKSNQLRKIFHALKQVQLKVKRTRQFDRSDLLRMTPELAYATGRGLIPRDFYALLKTCLSPTKLRDPEDFFKAFDFVETILAYHKYRSEVGYTREEGEK